MFKMEKEKLKKLNEVFGKIMSEFSSKWAKEEKYRKKEVRMGFWDILATLLFLLAFLALVIVVLYLIAKTLELLIVLPPLMLALLLLVVILFGDMQQK